MGSSVHHRRTRLLRTRIYQGKKEDPNITPTITNKPLFTELPTRLVVGDWILRLCRALRRVVAFSPYLIPEKRIKRGIKRVTNYRLAPVLTHKHPTG